MTPAPLSVSDLALALALALAVAAHLMGLRLFRRYPILSAFAAGVLCTLLVVSMTRASTPRPAPVPQPATHVVEGHEGVVPSPVAPERTPAPGWASVTPSLADDRDAARVGGDSPGPQALRGTASWFRSPADTSAAGPALRAALGRGWRGTFVRVTGPAGSAVVQLGDWMRRDRLIDLDDGAFRRVCGPLSLGLCRVRVVAIGAIALPETDR